MTTLTTLTELYARIEAGSGPDRELDARIICALLAPKGSKVEQSPFNYEWCIYEPCQYGRKPFKTWGRGPRGGKEQVTSSLDAALSLVERDGWALTALEWVEGIWVAIVKRSGQLVAEDHPSCRIRAVLMLAVKIKMMEVEKVA
jgi:hypothetical protein